MSIENNPKSQGEFPEDELTDEEAAVAEAELDAWLASRDPAEGLDQGGEQSVPVIDLLQGEERKEFEKLLQDLDDWNKGKNHSI